MACLPFTHQHRLLAELQTFSKRRGWAKPHILTTKISYNNLNLARLILEDGRIFKGKSLGASELSFGEIVFNTGMTGYQEILTDPSYAGQIITLTYPEIGNYGCNNEDIESAVYHATKSSAKPAPKSFAKGLVIKNYSPIVSNYRATESLDSFLRRENISAIYGLDTRALTKHIRNHGSMRAAIVPDDDKRSDAELIKEVKESEEMSGLDLATRVTCTDAYTVNTGGRYKVVALDFGLKQNIVERLVHYGCELHVLPASTGASEILAINPDGIFLSNGPGDPAAVSYAIKTVRTLVEQFDKPIFGICLGHQILSLALGAETFKLKFGHRGSNQPIKQFSTSKIEIASHNHGFAVSKENLPKDIEVTHENINDHTIAGIKIRGRDIFSVQYHPEASPGPHDSDYLFADFSLLMDSKVVV